MCSLGRLDRRCNLGVRGREQAGDLFGQRLVGGKPGKLVLPEVEITPGQAVEIGRIVVFGGHGPTIAHRRINAAFAGANRSLSHCGIGAKVTDPK
ncbi:MAG: hypothetical protein QOK41_1450 [Sphingomonadales bacterium]|nr:hypothetical protein [Sphingomonadales bacterium]